MALTHEFSFIQELIWSPPYRNPFPKCSDKVIWGLKSARQEQCVETGALMLIDLRRTLCNLLAALRASSACEEAKVLQLESDLDAIFVQQIMNAWKDDMQLQPLDQAALMARINACMEPFTLAMGGPAMSSVSLVEDAGRCDSDTSKQGLPTEDPGGKPVEQGGDGLKLESPGEDVLDVEMTLKAKVCAEEASWHLVFGLINHGCSKIDVDSLSFWPQDKRCEEVTTIKWARGEVTLNEKRSFICYSVKVPSNGPLDSPRLCFSWSYRKASKPGKRTRTETEEACYCALNTGTQLPKDEESHDEEASHEEERSFGKRIRSLFSWRGFSVINRGREIVLTNCEQDGDSTNSSALVPSS